MTSEWEHEALVVGAGLAGLWTARALARRGIRVLLVDHKREVGQSIATTGIFVRRSLESFDLPSDCLGPPVRQIRLYAPSGRMLPLESCRDEFRVGRMGMLYRRVLAEAVAAGAVWSPATHFVGSRPEGDGSRVWLRMNGTGRETTARFLLAADGARSTTAAALSLEANTQWIVGVEDVLTEVPLDGAPCFHCFLDPELAPGYLGWLVQDGEEVHLGVAGDPRRFDPRVSLERLRARAGRLMPIREGRMSERRGGWIPVNGILRDTVNSRGMLLGDAAGAVSPLTAGGLDPCLRLSELAAAQVAGYLQTGHPSFLAALLGGQFRRRFRGRLALRGIWSRIESARTMEIVCGSLRTPPGRRLARQVFFGSGSFPDPKPSHSASPLANSTDGEHRHGSRTANAVAPVSAG